MKIALLGYGTVGKSVEALLAAHPAGIEIKKILRRAGKARGPLMTEDLEEILQDPEIEAVVEVLSGTEPACSYIRRALSAGKHVVSANKAALASDFPALLALAEEHGVSLLFEASCGGGIPIIRPMVTSLSGDVIDEISGILNGTTNYILSEMAAEGAEFDVVLKEAQQRGYAERNPASDVEGYDACRKIAILSSIISGKQVDFEDIYCEGITKITVEDMKYAKAMGMTIKLLATCKRDGEKLNAMVAPCLLRAEHPLFAINGVFNSIFVHGNMLGDAMFYGSGAGKLPTASAVVGDIVEEARNLDRNLGVMWSSEKLALEDRRDVERRFFVRMKGSREVLQDRVASVFGMVQFVQAEGVSGEFGFVTEKMPEGSYEEKAEQFGGQILGMIRVEE